MTKEKKYGTIHLRLTRDINRWLIVITTLLLVGAFFLSVYIYYVPENNILPRLPQWCHRRNRPLRIAFRQRFDNIQQQLLEEPEEGNEQEPHVSVDNTCEGSGNETSNNSFDNPMFAEEGHARNSEAQEINDSTDGIKDEELTEIDLADQTHGSNVMNGLLKPQREIGWRDQE
uniref:Uncharacterized protein n=1 Tax=Megaselia scalaris TaxID=36166 RepID=T1GHV8_MEGSC